MIALFHLEAATAKELCAAVNAFVASPEKWDQPPHSNWRVVTVTVEMVYTGRLHDFFVAWLTQEPYDEPS